MDGSTGRSSYAGFIHVCEFNRIILGLNCFVSHCYLVQIMILIFCVFDLWDGLVAKFRHCYCRKSCKTLSEVVQSITDTS